MPNGSFARFFASSGGVFSVLPQSWGPTGSAPICKSLFTGDDSLVILAFFRSRRRIDTDRLGAMVSPQRWLVAGLGGLAYFAAMETGKASIVGPVTSLFPLLTVVCLRSACSRNE
jgi:hypothetical protein